MKKIFRDVDEDNDGELDFDEFCVYMERLRERKEVKDLFASIVHSDDRSVMSSREFHSFLRDIQKYPATMTLEECEALIMEYDTSNNGKSITLISFRKYLASQKNSAFAQDKMVQYQDMTQPLSHYFIASSHNTYLEGDQLQSNSSVNMYITVLLKGCRCVEIGQNYILIVTHSMLILFFPLLI